MSEAQPDEEDLKDEVKNIKDMTVKEVVIHILFGNLGKIIVGAGGIITTVYVGLSTHVAAVEMASYMQRDNERLSMEVTQLREEVIELQDEIRILWHERLKDQR